MNPKKTKPGGVLGSGLGRFLKAPVEPKPTRPPTDKTAGEWIRHWLSMGGYNENEASDMLAFFFDPSQPHGFGPLFIESLFQAWGRPVEDLSGGLRVYREVGTDRRKRIDIVIEATGWVLAIEHKILAGNRNPYDEYQRIVERQYPGKKHLFLLLCVKDGGNNEWTDTYGCPWDLLKYECFIKALERNSAHLLTDCERLLARYMDQLKREMTNISFYYMTGPEDIREGKI